LDAIRLELIPKEKIDLKGMIAVLRIHRADLVHAIRRPKIAAWIEMLLFQKEAVAAI
jgi:hypothetical protein